MNESPQRIKVEPLEEWIGWAWTHKAQRPALATSFSLPSCPPNTSLSSRGLSDVWATLNLCHQKNVLQQAPGFVAERTDINLNAECPAGFHTHNPSG